MGDQSGKQRPAKQAETAPERPPFSVLRVVLALTLTAALCVALSRFVGEPSQLLTTVRSLRFWPMVAAVGSSGIAVTLTALRMRWALAVGGDEVSARHCLVAVLTAWPVSILTPSRAGDFYRAAHLRREVPLVRGMGAVLTEKLVDALVIFAVAAAAALSSQLLSIALLCSVLVLSIGSVIVFPKLLELLRPGFLPETWRNKLTELLHSTVLLRSRPLLLAKLSGASLCVIGVACLHLWFLLAATEGSLQIGQVLRLWPLAMVAGALPLTPAGMATRDAAFLLLLGEQSSPAVLVATFLYSLTGWMYAAVGLPLLLRSGVLR